MAQRACEMDVGVYQKQRCGGGGGGGVSDSNKAGGRFCLLPTKQTELDEVVSSLRHVD